LRARKHTLTFAISGVSLLILTRADGAPYQGALMNHPPSVAAEEAELRRKISEAVADVFEGDRAPRRRRLTATERSMRASIAALERWSREDPTVNAQRGQAGLRAKFRAEIVAEFPDLGEDETNRRAEARYKAHMKRIRFAAMRKAGA
jgi:hypothetical protein